MRDQAAGVDDVERAVVPGRGAVVAIARHTGDVMHHGGPPVQDAVEQRRLADVGASNNGDRGPTSHGCFSTLTRHLK